MVECHQDAERTRVLRLPWSVDKAAGRDVLRKQKVSLSGTEKELVSKLVEWLANALADHLVGYDEIWSHQHTLVKHYRQQRKSSKLRPLCGQIAT